MRWKLPEGISRLVPDQDKFSRWELNAFSRYRDKHRTVNKKFTLIIQGGIGGTHMLSYSLMYDQSTTLVAGAWESDILNMDLRHIERIFWMPGSEYKENLHPLLKLDCCHEFPVDWIADTSPPNWCFVNYEDFSPAPQVWMVDPSTTWLSLAAEEETRYSELYLILCAGGSA